jgi:glutamine synthetase
MAAIDGIQRKLDPGPALDKDIYGLSPEELKNVMKAPGSLDEALCALKGDYEFLLKGDVFTEDVIDKWVSYKMAHEVQPIRLRRCVRIHLYYDI